MGLLGCSAAMRKHCSVAVPWCISTAGAHATLCLISAALQGVVMWEIRESCLGVSVNASRGRDQRLMHCARVGRCAQLAAAQGSWVWVTRQRCLSSRRPALPAPRSDSGAAVAARGPLEREWLLCAVAAAGFVADLLLLPAFYAA